MPRFSSILLLLPLLTLAACGGGTDAAAQEEAVLGATAAAAAVVNVEQANTPDEIGEAIGQVWLHAIEAATALVEERPAPQAALADLQVLHDQVTTQLVALGHKHARLAPAEQALVQAKVNQITRTPAFEAAFEAYTPAFSHYGNLANQTQDPKDRRFERLYTDMNVITQYAFFDLLRQQRPEEAARLGL